ncbi:MAG: glutathione S-transferase family protein [Xanthomonadales bacterium]|nr:glutathione S-transferase family protein [Xanthomonadales bacterium]
MYQLFGFKRSRSDRPMWLLEELGQPYEYYQIDFSRGDNRSDYFLGINPAGKVPALRHDDLTLTESGAICTYLADRHPEAGLIPAAGSPDRGLNDQWVFFALTELEQPLWTAGKHRFALPKEHRIPEIESTAHYEFEKAAALLSQGMGGREFMVADRFTVADIFITHTLNWAVSFKFSIDHPHLQDYLERMNARPARHKAMDAPVLEIPRPGERAGGA